MTISQEGVARYAPQESTFFDDGREIGLLKFIYSQPDIDSVRGNPSRVIALIDQYACEKAYLMNVGPEKGKIVTDLIAEVKPKTMVELGGYCGYSAVLFADAVRKAGGKRYFSLERNPEFAAVVLSLVDLAGLSDIVTVAVGPSDRSIARLHKEDHIDRIDMMFLDHYKPAYTTDLKLAEHLGLISKGSVLAADNVITPGNPPYLEYVRSTPEQKRLKITAQKAKDESKNNSNNNKNAYHAAEQFPDRQKNQYRHSVAQEMPAFDVLGNPNLIYDSKLTHSFEPTGVPDGVEISRCMGEGEGEGE